jgi:hypothetical protein
MVPQQLDHKADDQFDQVEDFRVHAVLLSSVKPVRYLHGLHLQRLVISERYLTPSVSSEHRPGEQNSTIAFNTERGVS